jgi:hypothetical protein
MAINWIRFLSVFLVINSQLHAQKFPLKKNEAGIFQLGARSTSSMFNDGGTDNFGLGLGGQFRLQLAERINTDWFFDYLTSDIGTVGNRSDYHIGWSVLYYPYLKKENDVVKSTLLKPFILAGHCFDYSRFVENKNTSNLQERWSSAVQAGIGTHINLNKRLDLTIMTQYMIHLGNHIHADVIGNALQISEEHGASLEGHLLTTISINYKIADLW